MPRSFPDSTQSNMFYGRAQPASGGRTWWAHIEFTRINIEPIVLRKKIEDGREVSAFTALARRISRKRISPSGQRTAASF